MLYMFIVTWAPEKSAEMAEKYQKWGSWAPKGMKEIGAWTDLWGQRSFRLCEITGADPKVMLASHIPWSDACQIEAVQVGEAKQMMGVIGEAMKLVPSK